MMYFLDCEFIEDGKTIDLISIGLVAKDGRSLYLCNKECDFSRASQWVWDNVLKPIGVEKGPGDGAMIPITRGVWVDRQYIKNAVLDFCDPEQHETPEFWGEWSSYDWVALCQLFGTMMDLPNGWPMRCRDVVQYCEDHLNLSTNDWPESLETPGNHNALMGAQTVKARWEWCNSHE